MVGDYCIGKAMDAQGRFVGRGFRRRKERVRTSDG